jgi:hypothetical protein
MRSITIMLLLLLPFAVLSQQREVTGRLTDETGLPLPQVTILIKGTTIGTMTDADGNYSINAPIGAILVFRFLGYGTREVLVTEESLTPVTGKEKKSRGRSRKKQNVSPFPQLPYQDSLSQNQSGVATLSPTSPTHKISNQWQIRNIKSIKKTANGYRIREYPDGYSYSGFGLSYSTSISVERVNRLPGLQRSFAQGRGLRGMLQWRGPDQQELFSWGPAISSLSFDGSAYPYDQNGKLMATGTGVEKPAAAYNPLSFFRAGYTYVNALSMNMPGPSGGKLLFDLEHRTKQSIIPTSDYRKISTSLKLKDYRPFKDVRVDASLTYNLSKGNLLARGANLSTLIGSIYTTPPTFDNTNGRSSDKAVSDVAAYRLADGSPRSFAPGLTDNPYGLLNALPDNEKNERVLSSVNSAYRINKHISLLLKGSLDLQTSQSVFGLAPGHTPYPDGRLTHRTDEQLMTNGSLTTKVRIPVGYDQITTLFTYQGAHMTRQLSRLDGLGYREDTAFEDIRSAAQLSSLNESLTRNTHEVIVNAAYEASGINARITNRAYFSNTVDYSGFTNFLPSASFNLNLADILYIYNVYELNVFASIGKSLREAPLLYNNWSYVSTTTPLENYQSFYESNELLFESRTTPETELSFEAGARIEVQHLNFEASYFLNTTDNFIVPVNTSGRFSLQNVARIHNSGVALSLGYYNYFRDTRLQSKLNWSTYQTNVMEVYGPNETVSLAGFSSVQTVLAEGQPLGAIYGSSYSRTESGEKLIGDDGFPLKNTSPRMIGNPIPDWILGWSSELGWKAFTLSFVLDYQHGGEMWNGTRAMLDYLGKSTTTAELRGVTDFVFEGVTSSGQPNTTPVSFYDPGQPLSANRWVRYGWEGIAEAYIENASALRLSQLSLSYMFVFGEKAIESIRLSAIAHNLFLVTPYRGADPTATLFGYSTGNGLDLFNTPSARSYAFQLTLKL